jgi:DNA-binding NtrC family response regulator
MNTILIVDEDIHSRRKMDQALRAVNFHVISADSPDAGLKLVRQKHPDVLVLDYDLAQHADTQFNEQIRGIDADLPIVYLSASASSEVAIAAMQAGAFDVLLKPLDLEQLQLVTQHALETRRVNGASVDLMEAVPVAENAMLLGRCPAMLEVYKEIGRVARENVTVLICGESGTGKELVAKSIFQHSQRAQQPFLAVNCAALSESLLESELFGHEKGAFTGADRQRMGKFEQCDGGTIFMDEIGDMSPQVQSKVLRLVQERTYERVGGTQTIGVDVRIIAATNRDLREMVEQGAFRLDLFHRLNEYSITLPPLRDRGDDLQLLMELFLAQYAKEMNKPIQGIAPEALEYLHAYSWPGNIRELQTVLKQSVLRANGSILIPEYLPELLQRTAAKPQTDKHPDLSSTLHDLQSFMDDYPPEESGTLYAEAIAFLDRYLLTRVLRESHGNLSKSALRLGITRGCLRNKLRKLGVGVESVITLEKPSLKNRSAE